MIAVAVCEKVTYKRGRQSRGKKIRIFENGKMCHILKNYFLFLCSRHPPSPSKAFQSKIVYFRENCFYKNGVLLYCFTWLKAEKFKINFKEILGHFIMQNNTEFVIPECCLFFPIKHLL